MQEQILVFGGKVRLGTDSPYFPQDAEGPSFDADVKPFFFDQFEVSNERFRRFVEATNYVTEAEEYGWSFVHELALSKDVLDSIDSQVAAVPWWLPVQNATWLTPEGNGTTVWESGRAHHPVIHVSLRDAEQFCAWERKGGRLPTENEFETANRGGKAGRLYAWGNLLYPRGEHRANLWQGTFPAENTAEDGYVWTAPVDALGPQNRFGFYHITGNVWEWTSDRWCDKAREAPDCWQEKSRNPNNDPGEVEYVKKGGSFLCHKSYCYRYRVAARTKNTANSSAYNVGFRCARAATDADVEAAKAAGAKGASGGRKLQTQEEENTDQAQEEEEAGRRAAQEAQERASEDGGEEDCGCQTDRSDVEGAEEL